MQLIIDVDKNKEGKKLKQLIRKKNKNRKFTYKIMLFWMQLIFDDQMCLFLKRPLTLGQRHVPLRHD